jgi:hypothetical protein
MRETGEEMLWTGLILLELGTNSGFSEVTYHLDLLKLGTSSGFAEVRHQ